MIWTLRIHHVSSRELDGAMSLRFLTGSTARTARTGSPPRRLAGFLAGIRYSVHTKPEVMYTGLTVAPHGVTGDAGAAAAHLTCALLGALTTLVAQIDALTEQIRKQLANHADGHIFTGLPRARSVRPARLLAEIGDAAAATPPRSR
ncbi:MAG: hypothetical protein ACR2GH_21075 [Pseudonocardia sp.]